MNLARLARALVSGFVREESALALIVIGVRLAVFSYAGSPLPYYDQWVMEFNDTLMSIATGNGFSALVFRHNEHMMLTTKMLTLLGFYVNGYWDVSFLVICSATIRALTALVTFRFISGGAEPRTKLLLWFLCALLFAVPYSGFNALNGMQVSFYLVDCALLWSLRATTKWDSPVTGGAALIGGTLLGVVSFASAVAIPACTLAAHLFQRRARRGFWQAWIISAAIALTFVFTGRSSTTISNNNILAHLSAAARFWLQIISWPTDSALVGVLMIVLAAIILFVVIKRGDCRTTANATIIGLGTYAVVNAAFIALSRDSSAWHMRHWDTIALLPFAIIAFGFKLRDQDILRRSVALLLSAVALGYICYMGNLIRSVSWPYIEAAHDTRSAALAHYRDLFSQPDFRRESQRINELLERDDFSFFDDPIGRFSLHPIVARNIVALRPQAQSLLPPVLFSVRSESRFGWYAEKIMSSGWLLVICGIILGFAATRRKLDRSTSTPTDMN